MPGKKKCTKADRDICSRSPCKYDALTKKIKRRKANSPTDSPKVIEVKRTSKNKTLWMRWLWAYHCENKKVNPDVKYGQSMTEAGEIYHTDEFGKLGKSVTDNVLRTFAKKKIN